MRLQGDAFCEEGEELPEKGVLLEDLSYVLKLSSSVSESSTSLSVS
jgi:hypothetical protein